MVMITKEIKRSLDAAGVFNLYHEKSLTDFGMLGVGYGDWIKEEGPRLATTGGLVVFKGVGQAPLMKMVARAFHINGQGVRIKSLSQLSNTFRRELEREDMDDAPILFISPAQASGSGCPLTWFDMDRITTYIQTRVERGQMVFLHWASDAPLIDRDPMDQWWPKDFVHWVSTFGSVVEMADIEARGKVVSK